MARPHAPSHFGRLSALQSGGDHPIWHLAIPAASIVIRTLAIYLALLLGLRIFGKREVGQFTLFDLAMVLLVANAVQPAMTGPDSSLLGGLIIMATLFAANRIVAWLVPRSPLLRRAVEGQATIIGRDGAWDVAAMRREGLDEGECEMALREHGVADIKDVSLAVLETDGTISVVPSETSLRRGRRRVRYRRM